MKIIVERSGVPTAKIHVEIISNHPQKLGEHRPVTFVLPGGPGASHELYLKYSCLKPVTDVVFHDPRGCGQSDKDHLTACTMDNYIDDVEAIRKHLSLDKVIILGKSYGSMCALGYALRYQPAVEKLILATGAPSYHFLEKAKKNILRLGTSEQIKICEKLWAGNFTSQDELLYYFKLTQPLYSRKAGVHFNSDLNKKISQFSYEVLNEGFRHSFGFFDYENELQNILCRTLILGGRWDWINDIKYAELMVKRIPHSELRIFENASHALEEDAGEEYFQTIADFIGS